MFSQKQRLSTTLFDEVFKSGKTKNGQDFLLKYKENNLDYPRFAVSVSKKKFKTAVERHLVKRKFINALQKSKFLNYYKDFVFVLNESCKNKKQEELLLTINNLELE